MAYQSTSTGSVPIISNRGVSADPKIITNFEIDYNDIKAAGETRRFAVLGTNGAVFSLEVKNEDGHYYNFQTNLFQSGLTRLNNISISDGKYYGNIKFPKVTDADQYDFYLFAESISDTIHSKYNEFRFEDNSIDINSSSGSNSNLVQKVIYQTLNVDITINGISPEGLITGSPTSATVTTSRGKSIGKIPFSFTWTATSTRTLSVDRQPVGRDMMAFITASVGSTPVNIPGENIYPTVTAADKVVNGAVTSGTNVTMDDDYTGLWAVGDRITGNAALDARTQATAVTVTAVNVGSNAKVFTMSEAIAIADDETLSFSNRRNHRWNMRTADYDLRRIKNGMRQVKGDFFEVQPTVKDYLTQTTVNEGEVGEYKIDDVRVPGLETKGMKPVFTRDSTTKVKTSIIGDSSNQVEVTFSDQALLTFGGGLNAKIFGYGTSEVERLTGYDVVFSDLRAKLTEVSTTTTAAVNASTSVPITNRAGIMDGISTVTGVGIDSSVAAPKVSSGAGSVTGAGTIVLSAAQTLENGATLTFPGASTVVTVSGNIKVNKVGNENVTLRFDLERFVTMH